VLYIGDEMNMHPLPPLKIRYVNPRARLVPARVLMAECSKDTGRIKLKE
jgi:hypothetical protein